MITRLITIALLVAALLPRPSTAAEPTAIIPSLITGTAGVDYVSSYAFRGTKLAEDSAQLTATVNVGSAYVTAWANQPLHRRANEVDLTIGTALPWGLDAGLTAYTYPHAGLGDRTTYEPYVGYSREAGWLKGSVYGYRDLTLRLTTAEAKLSAKLPALGRLELGADASVGTVQGHDTPRYTYWGAGPSLRFKLTESLTLAASTQWTATDTSGSSALWTSRAGASWSF